MFSFPYFPLGGPFVYLLYTLGFLKVLFGGLIYFAFTNQKKIYLLQFHNFNFHALPPLIYIKFTHLLRKFMPRISPTG